MIRRSFVYSILFLLLILACAASAEEAAPATPTDLACPHEHTRTTIYFFDSPAYAPVDAGSHRVSGPAAVETVCLDCGKTISSVNTDNAEEIRPHSMKKDACVLCGYRRAAARPAERSGADRSGEETLFAREEGAGKLLSLTLTRKDLAAMENASVSTVLVRGKTGAAAIAMEVEDALTQAEAAGSDLYLELAEQEDGSLFAALYLVSGSGEKTELNDEGITLRFYQENREGVRVSVAPADSDILVETESSWNEHGYWSVQYLEEGTYFLLQ